jgi:hypothetical protein
VFSLIGGLPSGLSSSAGALSFESFIGTMPLSDSSPPCMSVDRSNAFTDRPALQFNTGIGEVSRFSCMLFPGMPGVFDYGGLP